MSEPTLTPALQVLDAHARLGHRGVDKLPETVQNIPIVRKPVGKMTFGPQGQASAQTETVMTLADLMKNVILPGTGAEILLSGTPLGMAKRQFRIMSRGMDKNQAASELARKFHTAIRHERSGRVMTAKRDVRTFDDIELHDDLHRSLKAAGFRGPVTDGFTFEDTEDFLTREEVVEFFNKELGLDIPMAETYMMRDMAIGAENAKKRLKRLQVDTD